MKLANLGIVAFVGVLAVIAAAAVWHWDRGASFQPMQAANSHDGSRQHADAARTDSFQPDGDLGEDLLAAEALSAPTLYRQTRQWGVSVGRPVGVAVDAQDQIYVAGEKSVQIFSFLGDSISRWELQEPPRCMTVAGSKQLHPGAVWLGYEGRLEIRNGEGKMVGGWPLPLPRSQPTSIALSAAEVFVADFTAKCVYRFDGAGKLLGRIGLLDRERGYPGLILPNPFCDLVVDSAGLLWVVNPGLRRLEGFDPRGRLERFWGQSGASAEAFFGCCNPAHVCLLPDGRFVTSEKGLLRIKVYSAEGILEGWVARPDHWSSWGKEQHWIERIQAADVAADSQGRVIALHLGTGQVHVFEPLAPPPPTPSGDAESPAKETPL